MSPKREVGLPPWPEVKLQWHAAACRLHHWASTLLRSTLWKAESASIQSQSSFKLLYRQTFMSDDSPHAHNSDETEQPLNPVKNVSSEILHSATHTHTSLWIHVKLKHKFRNKNFKARLLPTNNTTVPRPQSCWTLKLHVLVDFLNKSYRFLPFQSAAKTRCASTGCPHHERPIHVTTKRQALTSRGGTYFVPHFRETVTQT